MGIPTSDSVSRSETCRSVPFEIEIPFILLFLNLNKNSQNSPKRMHPQINCPMRLYRDAFYGQTRYGIIVL